MLRCGMWEIAIPVNVPGSIVAPNPITTLYQIVYNTRKQSKIIAHDHMKSTEKVARE